MIQKLRTVLMATGVAALFGLVATSVVVAPAYAAPACTGTNCVSTGINSVGNTGGGTNLPAIIKTIVNILLFVIGAVAVIMIVVGGIKYVTSNGDSSAVTNAKNTIFYAVIGLIVAVMAYAIVNFVVTQFVK